MTERAARRRFGAAAAIKAILALQVGIAGILFARDIAGSLALPGLTPRLPELTEPVRPGDQTRRYDPSLRPTTTLPPGTELPGTGDIPDRLRFEPAADAPGVLTATGTIAPGDADRFEAWLATTAEPPGALRLDSPGGSVADALAIGRRLREIGAATEIAAGAVCLSACPYILAAGTERRVDAAGHVGVHQHYFGESTILPAFVAVEDIQRGQAEVMEHLQAMGVDPLLMRHSLATPADEIYLLVPDELTGYRLATEITGI